MTAIKKFLAFVTGSHKYGVPTLASDVDLVVLVSPTDLETLKANADRVGGADGLSYVAGPTNPAHSTPLRFGDLNLICVTDERQYEAWKQGTDRLYKSRPVTREHAVAVLSKLREAAADAPARTD